MQANLIVHYAFCNRCLNETLDNTKDKLFEVNGNTIECMKCESTADVVAQVAPIIPERSIAPTPQATEELVEELTA